MRFAGLMNIRVALLSLFLAVVIAATSASAISLGQLDDFEDATLKNWSNGGVAGVPAPTNVNSGGPGGAGDNYLQIASAGGGGAGSRLTIFNHAQWLGNYIAAGVTAIEVDLRNSGPTQLSIRLAFKSSLSMGGPAYLTQAAILPSGSGWQHFTFSLAPASLIPVAGPPAYNTLFSGGIAEVRFINEIGANNSNGDIITAQLGIDNIRAVPEPATFYLLGAGAVALACRRLKRARS